MDRSGRSAQVSDDSSDDDEPGSGTDAASGKPSETQPQIKDGFENSTFVTDNYDLDLLELKRNGPKLHESTNQLQRVSTLPWICERHRMELLMD